MYNKMNSTVTSSYIYGSVALVQDMQIYLIIICNCHAVWMVIANSHIVHAIGAHLM